MHMDWTAVEAVAAVASVGVAVWAILVARSARVDARTAQRAADDANRLATQANALAKDANILAAAGSQYASARDAVRGRAAEIVGLARHAMRSSYRTLADIHAMGVSQSGPPARLVAQVAEMEHVVMRRERDAQQVEAIRQEALLLDGVSTIDFREGVWRVRLHVKDPREVTL